MQKFSEVKFSKDRVKIQIWGKPVIFSHELCLYITRFATIFATEKVSCDFVGETTARF